MLPKNRRIPRKMFPFLFKGGQTYKNGVFLLRLAVKQGQKSRFSFSVSKKISKSAVVRNRLRRTGYRLLQNRLDGIKPNVYALFSFLKLPTNKGEISEHLEDILKKSKLI